MTSREKTERHIWERQAAQLRDPMRICSGLGFDEIDARSFNYSLRGDFVDILEELGVTLVFSREYEHLLCALRAKGSSLEMSWHSEPHPSGLVADRSEGVLCVASTRNPNMLIKFSGVKNPRMSRKSGSDSSLTLIPKAMMIFPGRTYMHDIALIDGCLYANAVGFNCVIRFDGEDVSPVWWPKSIDGPSGPRMDQNYLQLNGIAAGDSLENSFFSASCDVPSSRRPGHKNFKVDGRGVIFSGRTREAAISGLTRPHSARFAKDGTLYVLNSGYGQLCLVDLKRASFGTFASLPGWTRGLCFSGKYAFVGTSRVLPRFEGYAPGLIPDKCECGIHVIDMISGKIEGSVLWPYGNQIFAIDWFESDKISGFAASLPRRNASKRLYDVFYDA